MKIKQHNCPKCGNSRHEHEDYCTICAAEIASRTPAVAAPVRHSRFYKAPIPPAAPPSEPPNSQQQRQPNWRNN